MDNIPNPLRWYGIRPQGGYYTLYVPPAAMDNIPNPLRGMG
jgi:hypothetical protein